MTVPNLENVSLIDLFGAGSVDVHLKFTNEAVLDRWDELMVGINDIVNIQGSAGNPASDQITGTQHANFQNSINGLLDLAKNGHSFAMEDPANPGTLITVRDVITVEMARDLDNLLRTIESADSAVQISGTNATISLGALQSWRDFAEVTPVINDLVRHMNNARAVGGAYLADEGVRLDGVVDELGRLKVGSLQSMVELLYVKTGTELMADNLDNLESALTSNKNAIEALTSLQSYHNELTAFSKGQLPVELGDRESTLGNPTTGISANERKDYADSVGNFFNGISPELGPGMANMYEVLVSYQKTSIDAYNQINSINGISTFLFDVLELANNVSQSSDDTLVTDYWRGHRAKVYDIIRVYREEVNKLNAARSRINELMQPFVDLLADPNNPGAPVTISLSGIIEVDIPLNGDPLPLPDFTTQDIPGYIGGSGDNLSGSDTVATNDNATLNDVRTFLEESLLPFRDSLDPFLDNSTNVYELENFRFSDPTDPGNATAPPTVNIDIDTFVTALYSQNKIINGDPATGAPPIPIFDMAKNIKAQKTLIDQQIANLATDPNQANNPNALLARLQAVSNDLQKSGINSIPDISNFGLLSSTDKKKAIEDITKFSKDWILDGLADLTGNNSFAGKIQENLGFAISAGQSLNDQQKEETRRFLFLFEEFYKSASAILTKITQLLEKMAQNINR